jgi:hypothetical protein
MMSVVDNVRHCTILTHSDAAGLPQLTAGLLAAGLAEAEVR